MKAGRLGIDQEARGKELRRTRPEANEMRLRIGPPTCRRLGRMPRVRVEATVCPAIGWRGVSPLFMLLRVPAVGTHYPI